MFCRKTILKLLDNAAMEPAPPPNMTDDMQKVEYVRLRETSRFDLIKLPSQVICYRLLSVRSAKNLKN